MPHFRKRHAADWVKKLAALWPVVGVAGPRQVGKTTFLENHFDFASNSSMDDDATRADAENSAVSFLSRLEPPALVDEIQKVPKLFDALKLLVHRQRKPGRYFVTGSTSFSEGAGIRESLTGRIGLCQLFPLTLSEGLGREAPLVPALRFKDGSKPRIGIEDFSRQMTRGGMPVPMFLRDPAQEEIYWNGWLTTGVLRDLARFLGRGFEPDFAFGMLDQLGSALREGELPTSAHFRGSSSRKLNRYLAAFESVFLLRKIPCHELGTGKDVWVPTDSGLATYLMKARSGEGAALSAARLVVINELLALSEYGGQRLYLRYFKSAKGTPVDFVFQGIPVRLVPMAELGRGPWGWHEKPLRGAMKKLGAKKGVLLAPVERVRIEKDLMILPWSIWS